MAPVFDEASSELAGKVKMVKLNVDESPHTPGKFNIRGIPTLIAFKDGKAVATKVGAMNKSQLVDWLASVG
jgi:thioredoxin 1